MSYGLIGLGAMGSNLALNISRKHNLHLYNRTKEKTVNVISKGRPNSMHGFDTIMQMIQSMEKPRTIITMLPHGNASHTTIKHAAQLLDNNDTIIDCANQHYDMSIECEKICKQFGVNYLGVGMSGGAHGALNGPAIMIGGDENVYNKQKGYLDSFCNNVVYIDNKCDSGHFTKMVHNGIEYVMLQAIADVYAYLNYDYNSMYKLLSKCVNSEMNGYLIYNAFNVLEKYNIESISDKANMNNTGLWCVEYAYKHGINVPCMHAAVQSRIASNKSKKSNSQKKNTCIDIEIAFHSLRFVYACAFIEGNEIINYKNLNSTFVRKAWSKDTIIECPMVMINEKKLCTICNESIDKTRVMVIECSQNGIPIPCISNALQFYDFTHQRKTQMNFLMAQRNVFGQHEITYD